MTFEHRELLARLAAQMRHEIAPAVDGEYRRTQAYMAAVILERLAREAALGERHAMAESDDMAQLLTELNREGTELLSNVVPRELFFERYQRATGIKIDGERCAYYQLPHAMRSAAFWMSAAGLYADGSNDDLRLARAHWSATVALERAVTELGY